MVNAPNATTPVSVAPVTTTTTTATNWLDNIKSYLKEWSDKLELNSYKLLEMASYFAVGFFFGFLLKRHARILFTSIIILVLALTFCAYFDLVFINWVKIRQFTNINPNDTLGNILQNSTDYLKENVMLVLSACVGVLLGLKVG